MDDRILVEVYIPFVQTSLSIYLPLQAKLQDCMDVCIAYIEKKQIPIQKQFYLYHEMTRRFWQWIAVLPKVVYIQHPISF